ncbi:MAG: hypothetical protein PHP25_03885 [Candidatus Moranbacteria bacterium]|nr:hypothetical protein [Candidatus Moranbacteria bacterium]
MINIIESIKAEFWGYAEQKRLELVLEKKDRLKYKSPSRMFQLDRDEIFLAMKDAIAKSLEKAGIDFVRSSFGIIIQKTTQKPRILITVDADTEFCYFIVS